MSKRHAGAGKFMAAAAHLEEVDKSKIEEE